MPFSHKYIHKYRMKSWYRKQSWIKYNIKTFRADLKTFPKRHIVKATLETTNVLSYTIYISILKKKT